MHTSHARCRPMLVILVSVLAGACAQVVDVDEREIRNEAELTAIMEVKAALLNAEGVWAAPIRVVFDDGTIRLLGFVADAEERRRAVAAARQATSDVPVVDELQVCIVPDGDACIR